LINKHLSNIRLGSWHTKQDHVWVNNAVREPQNWRRDKFPVAFDLSISVTVCDFDKKNISVFLEAILML